MNMQFEGTQIIYCSLLIIMTDYDENRKLSDFIVAQPNGFMIIF